MRIVTLVENTTENEQLTAKHGLCLYIETERHKILFDLGPDETFVHNARALGIDLSQVDTVVISHGHGDHGGGLGAFFQVNRTAKVYIHPDAFLPHYSAVMKIPVFNGIDDKYSRNKNIVYTSDQFVIDKELRLISNVTGHKCLPTANQLMLEQRNGRKQEATFSHEQSLLIQEKGKVVLLSGCAHRGIVNIMKQAYFMSGKAQDVVISGFHLVDPRTKKRESNAFLDVLAYNLNKYNCQYFTCHCTGMEAYQYLSKKMGDKLQYISTGTELIIE